MSLSQKMASANEAEKAQLDEALTRSDRNYRLAKRIDIWKSMPGIGEGMENFDEATQRNLACNLDNQAAVLNRLSETQTADAFQGFTPENMLRLVRLSMPNIVRNKIFTEFAMETARDSIKYVRPVYSKTFNGKTLVDKTDDYNRLYDDVENTRNSINDPEARKAIYESTEDRINQELANGLADGHGKFLFKQVTEEEVPEDYDKKAERADISSKWGVNGAKVIDGYFVIYVDKETEPFAAQNKENKKFYVNPDYTYTSCTYADGELKIEGADYSAAYKAANTPEGGTAPVLDVKKLKAFGRYDSETDFEGDYLGEVEIRTSDYFFEPRPTSIGVSWSSLSEIVLDTSFNVSAEEYLVTYASQAIRVALDYRAIKLAYQQARTNGEGYRVYFDAAYNQTAKGHLEGYMANAQTFGTAIATVADNMLNDINRGGVSRLVAGPSAGTYLTLNNQFTNKGAQYFEGAHQMGELNGAPLFKVPSSIIPTNEILTVWKNPNNEADISIAFGTLVPFLSTGLIQRKNFYKEAGLATFGDWAVINKRYLATIVINNLKDKTAR
jgi:hypothetical protein